MNTNELEAVARAIHPGDWWQSDSLPVADHHFALYKKERDHARYLARRAIEALDHVRGTTPEGVSTDG